LSRSVLCLRRREGRDKYTGILFSPSITINSLSLKSIVYDILHVSKNYSVFPLWPLLAVYLVVMVLCGVLYATGKAMANIPLTIFLIALTGTLPAVSMLALGTCRVHVPKEARWPTTWRRCVLALTSGATLAVVLSMAIELLLTVLAAHLLGITQLSTLMDNSDQPILADSKTVAFLLIQAAIIAPLVEEMVKPLAVAVLIGRISSVVEAFVLGMACGTGFDLFESTGYIGSAYNHWVEMALQRGAGMLLHGFGTGMVALGWYFITHPRSAGQVNHVLAASGCWCYALLQHALWNGLQLLSAPIGPYLNTGYLSDWVGRLPLGRAGLRAAIATNARLLLVGHEEAKSEAADKRVVLIADQQK